MLPIASTVKTTILFGKLVLGIATMHKSNAVPIFSNDQAVDVAKMRRG